MTTKGEGKQALLDNQGYGETNFGTSNYGERLDYTKPVYRDVWACVIFLGQVLAIIGVAIWFWASKYESLTDNSDGNTAEIPSFNLAGIIVTIIGCAVAGIVFGLFWLFLLKRFAAQIIKTMLFFNLFCWVCVILVGAYVATQGEGGMPLIIIGIFGLLIFGLYTWCVWGRIPFASALLVCKDI